MTVDAHTALEAHYQDLEKNYTVLNSGKYGALVTANGNSNIPIHRWFRMKEAYSSQLLEEVLNDTSLRDTETLRLFDPFSGSGTTGVSAGDLVSSGKLSSARVTALEVNPFLHLLSSAKMLAHSVGPQEIQLHAELVAQRASDLADGRSSRPTLSTFSKEAYFPVRNLDMLLALRASIDALDTRSGTQPSIPFLKLALAGSVEPASNLRRDGRALRLSKGKACTNPIDVFLKLATQIAEDVKADAVDFAASVIRTDCRIYSAPLSEDHDLALFSPPYPNNIDYTEVYKLEAWLLGLYSNSGEFSEQRRRSLRSHNSLRWGNSYGYITGPRSEEMERMLRPILTAIPDDRYKSGREEVVQGYADDMYLALESVFSALRPGGSMAIVVGNSMHGKNDEDYVIASDLILAAIADFIGFDSVRIDIARYPKRRSARSSYLRESIVFAQKPFFL